MSAAVASPPALDLARIDELFATLQVKQRFKEANTFKTNPYGHVPREVLQQLRRRGLSNEEARAYLRNRKRKKSAGSSRTDTPVKRLQPSSELTLPAVGSEDPSRRKYEKELQALKTLLPYLDTLYHVDTELEKRHVEPIVEKVIGAHKPAADVDSRRRSTGSCGSTAPTAVCRTRTTGNRDEDDIAGHGHVHESSMPQRKRRRAEGATEVEMLVKRYPAVCRAAGGYLCVPRRVRHRLHLTKSIADIGDLPYICLGITAKTRVKLGGRSASFMLRVIEKVYDAATAYYKDAGPGALERMFARFQESRAEALQQFLNVDGVNLARHLKVDAVKIDATTFVKPWLFLPDFFANILKTDYGADLPYHVACLEFLAMLEASRTELLEADMFSNFLRQLLDDTALAFFLHARDLIQSNFGLSLKNLKLRTLDAKVAGFIRPADSVLMRHHQKLKDGTLVPLLSKEAAYRVAYTLAGEDEELAAYFINLLKTRQVVFRYPPDTDVVRPNSAPITAVEVTHFLGIAVEEFVKAPDDIVDTVRYDDDGRGLVTTKRLQDAVGMDKEIKVAEEQATQLKAQLNDLKIEAMKLQKKQAVLEREVALGHQAELMLELAQARTALSIRLPEVSKLEIDVRDAETTLKSLVDTQNSTWDDIMSYTAALNSPSKGHKGWKETIAEEWRAPPNPNFQRAAKVFGMAMQRSLSRHTADVEVQEKFEEEGDDWHAELACAEHRSAAKIQKCVRRFLRDRDIKRKARLERERVERERLEAEEARREQELKEQRHRMAEEALVLSRVHEVEKKRLKEERSNKERAKQLKIRIAYCVVDRICEAKNQALLAAMLKDWRIFRRECKTRRMMAKRMLRGCYRFWRAELRRSRERTRAAITIQSVARRYIVRKHIRPKIHRVRLNERMVAEHLLVRGGRLLRWCFMQWVHTAHVLHVIEQRFKGSQSRLKRRVWDRWRLNVKYRQRIIDKSVRVIQCAVRVYRARDKLFLLKRRGDAAKRIQSIVRGFSGRRKARLVQAARRELERLSQSTEAISHRMLQRRHLTVWKRVLVIRRMARRSVSRQDVRAIQQCFNAWTDAAQAQISKRKAEEEHRVQSACKLQATFRGFVCRRDVADLFVEWRATIHLQRMWRGCACRIRYRVIRHEHYAAVSIQKVWRGHHARRSMPGFKMQDAFAAAQDNDVARLLNYFITWPSLKDEADEVGNNVLHYSAMGGAKRTAKLCLRKRLDPNMYTGEGRTALHLAIRSPVVPDRDELAPYLLDHGAWIEAPDYDGHTPLLLAAKLGRAAIVRELLERGANIQAVDASGYSALHLAASNEYHGTVRELLGKELYVDAQTADGSTALHLAVATGNVELTELLLDYGASPEVQDARGMTALHIAASIGSEALVRLLLDRGATVDARDAMGRTALFVAVGHGHSHLVEVMTKYDAEVDVVDVQGDTAMHTAVRNRDGPSLRALLSSGANANIRNADGDLPTHLAAACGDTGMMDDLLQYGASIRKKNWENLTPVGVARMSAQTKMIEYLGQNFVLTIKGPDADEGAMVEWQQEYEALHHEWDKVWDGTTASYYYVHRITGEASWKPPAAEVHALIEKRDHEMVEVAELKTRVKTMTGDINAGKREYLEMVRAENAELENQMKMDRASTMITKHVRVFLARRRLAEQRLYTAAARTVQRALRYHLAAVRRRNACKQASAALKIQAAYRGYYTRVYWKQLLRPWLEEQRARTRISAWLNRRVPAFRARKARRLLKLKAEGPTQYEDWQHMLAQAGKPLRSFGVFEEYNAPGGRDVKFYCHKVTGRCTWEKPEVWARRDLKDFKESDMLAQYGFTKKQSQAARQIQSFYRSQVARQNLGFLIKSKKVMADCEVRYLSDPTRFPNLFNYTLYQHVFELDYKRAAQLYEKAYRMMAHRGPDVHVLLFAYAIFLAASGTGDYEKVHEYIDRANKAMQSSIMLERRSIHPFKMSYVGFFLRAALHRPSSDAFVNLALVKQLVFNDYEGAEKAYLKALEFSELNPHVVDNFRVFLRDYKKTDITFDELYRDFKQRQDAREALEKMQYLSKEDAAERAHRAAIKVQAIWRGYIIRKQMDDGTWFEQHSSRPTTSSRPPTSQEGMLVVAAAVEEERYTYTAADAATGAVSDWVPAQDEQGNTYWYNATAGESSWTPPDAQSAQAYSAQLALVGSFEGETLGGEMVEASSTALSNVWQMYYDQDGNAYWFNSVTGASQWETPDEAKGYIVPAEQKDNTLSVGQSEEAEGQMVLYQIRIEAEKVGEREGAVVAAGGWEVVNDGNGNVYYYNRATGASQWEPPEGMPLGQEDSAQMVVFQEAADGQGGDDAVVREAGEWQTADDGQGNTYYFNRRTGESRWELP